MNQWIDFGKLRSQLRFEDVLRLYQIEVNRKGSQHTGHCPLPNHGERKQSACFSAELDKGMFRCFGCKAQGNVLDFAAYMEQVDPRNGSALRIVAVDLAQKLGLLQPTPPKRQPSKPEAAPRLPLKDNVLVNEPLDFELKDLDQTHSHFMMHGVTANTIAHFGLGVAQRGFLKGRLAIPLHNHAGRLIGYAGKHIDDSVITRDNPQYRFPERRERNGVVHEFDPTAFLYNEHRNETPADELIVVAGFETVWELFQHGLTHVVSTMSVRPPRHQLDQLTRHLSAYGGLWVVASDNAEQRGFAESVILHTAQNRFVRWLKLPPSTRSKGLSRDVLRPLFAD